ncbi:MAG TPA: DUF1622 domain-containing protein [Gammaproteobacteria bacterium]|jgi:uncharacterized membrane protein|nr:DUF1622 domain-containing protein [Gammaproteobacteria bacterium]
MGWQSIHSILSIIQHGISFIGVLIILSGVLTALYQYACFLLSGPLDTANVNTIRLNLGRVLILGLEFIIAADLIGTTTTPDYYAVGLLAIIVLVRTVLSFSINRELMTLSK